MDSKANVMQTRFQMRAFSHSRLPMKRHGIDYSELILVPPFLSGNPGQTRPDSAYVFDRTIARRKAPFFHLDTRRVIATIIYH